MNRIFDFLDNKQSGLMKVIGVSTEEEYNYLLRKIYFKNQGTDTIMFTEGIPFPSNVDIISQIQESAYAMNLACIEREEINLTNDFEFNINLKRSINSVLGNILRERVFKSENVRVNFFVKEIVWLYEIISKTNLNKLPTVIYYGEMTEDEKLLLEILSSVGFKILVFSSDVDIDIKSTENIIYDKRIPYVKYTIRVANGKDELPVKEQVIQDESLIVVKSLAKQAKEQIENDFLESGIFKPWKFRKGFVKSINIDSVVEDITSYITEDSRFRPNFKCEGSTVYIPNFFIKINGVYRDKEKYSKLLNVTINNPLTIVRENLSFVKLENLPNQEIYSLAFAMNEEQTEIINEKIKSHKLYNLKAYNIDAQDLVIKKLNEFYLLYKEYVTLKEFLNLVYSIITLKESIMVLIENFDFPYKIPKMIIYLEKREALDKLNAMIIHFFKVLGFDIVIFSPMGAPCIEDYLFDKHLSVADLEEMIFDFSLENAKSNKNKKVSIFKKLFN